MLYLCSVDEEESSSASTPSLDLSLIPLSADDKNSDCNSAGEEEPGNGTEPKAADEAAKDQGSGNVSDKDNSERSGSELENVLDGQSVSGKETAEKQKQIAHAPQETQEALE